MSDAKRFEGMTAVVTGGASGIGLTFARRFVAEGGRVTLWDNDPARLKAATAELGDKSRAERVDVVNPADVERATEASHAAMGQIDALVCSAGVAGLNAPVIDYPIDEWKRVFDIDVHGLFYCNRFVARLMKARGYGRIVNIASIAGKEGNPNGVGLQRRRRPRSSASPSRSARNSPRTASASTPSRRRRSTRRSSSRSRRRTSPTCARKFRWSASARSRKPRR